MGPLGPPRYALEMARALSGISGETTLLSLAEGAELLQDKTLRGVVDLPLYTYANAQEFVPRTLDIRRVLRPIMQRLEAERPDAAIVTMMGYWDIFLIRKLRDMGVPVVSLVHDAEVSSRRPVPSPAPPPASSAAPKRRHRHADGVRSAPDEQHVSLAGKVHATIPLVAFDFADLNFPPPCSPKPTASVPCGFCSPGA